MDALVANTPEKTREIVLVFERPLQQPQQQQEEEESGEEESGEEGQAGREEGEEESGEYYIDSSEDEHPVKKLKK